MGFRRYGSEEAYVPLEYKQGPQSGLYDIMAQQDKTNQRRLDSEESFSREKASNTANAGKEVGNIIAGSAENYYQKQKEGRKSAAEEAERSQRMALGGEQLKGAQQQNALQSEFGRTNMEQALKQAQAQTGLAELQTKEAQASSQRNARLAQELYPDAKQGETMADYQSRLGFDMQKAQVDVQKMQAKIAQGQLSQSEKMLPLQLAQAQASLGMMSAQQKAANLGLSEQERGQRVRQLSAQLEMDPSAQNLDQVARQMVTTGAKPDEVAEAAKNIKSAKQQSEFLAITMRNADPNYAFSVQKSLEGKNTAQLYQSALTEMDNAIKAYKNSNPISDRDAMHGSREQFRIAAENMGYTPQQIEEITKSVFQEGKMDEFLARAKGDMKRKLNVFTPYDPSIQKSFAAIDQIGGANTGTGVVQNPFQQAPMMPAQGDPGAAPQPQTQGFQPNPQGGNIGMVNPQAFQPPPVKGPPGGTFRSMKPAVVGKK